MKSTKENSKKTFGRGENSDFSILEESISRNHGEIYTSKGKFYIKDLGSKSGTFYKIEEKCLLEIHMIIEMGSQELEILDIIESEDFNSASKVVKLAKIKKGFKEDIILMKFDSQDQEHLVGKTKNASIRFKNDGYLSSKHAKFVIEDKKIYIVDLGSTNGFFIYNILIINVYFNNFLFY